MLTIKEVFTQTAVNSANEFVIPTLLTVDGRTGWNIKRVRAVLASSVGIVAAAHSNIICQLNTEIVKQSFNDADNIATLLWSTVGTAASTGAFPIDNAREWVSDAGRLTVEPELIVHIESSGLTAAMTINFLMEYETVKLTDMEMVRLLQGGT